MAGLDIFLYFSKRGNKAEKKTYTIKTFFTIVTCIKLIKNT